MGFIVCAFFNIFVGIARPFALLLGVSSDDFDETIGLFADEIGC